MRDDASRAIRIGQNIGPYRIEGLLGMGGMGRVYLARDSALCRTVAIKVVDHTRKDPQSLRSLLREARMAAALNHPSICSVHEVGRLGDEPFIVMEHVKGLSLATVLHRMGALPIETAIHYKVQIVDAIAHAHEHEIVHGDLKTSNMMIEPNGRVKILDFGLAVQSSLARSDEMILDTTALAPPSSCAGTVPYMAPELLRGREADELSDIWALGVVLFEMLAGFRPFRGATAFELAASILSNEPVPFSVLIPQSLRTIIERCLLPVPSERYQCARELASALDDVRWRQWQSSDGVASCEN
jgi:serine/threonine protein kinase